MGYLNEISDFLESFCEAISSILGTEVTIIDNQFRRIVGTGIYLNRKYEIVAHSTFFAKIIKNKKMGFIKDVKKEYACQCCTKRFECKEKANLGYPIIVKEKVIGIIGIIAITEEQRVYLEENIDTLISFFHHMVQLIENKITLLEQHNKLQEKIYAILNSNERVTFQEIVTKSSKMKDLFVLGKNIAKTNSTVLLTGESGTGKELFARALHYESDRKDEAFVPINCAAVPENILESELFGYEAGAFTGAIKSKIGKFEIAHKGTLFLDEIGDMPLNMQAKLLRVLQEKRIERLGGTNGIDLDIRLVCATNKNLLSLVEKNLFREDLFYRIHVIPIHLPPLRERKEDIPLLIEYFQEKFKRQFSKQDFQLPKVTFQNWENEFWKGNIRELMNAVEYAVITGDTNRFQKYEIESEEVDEQTLKLATESFEKTYIKKIMQLMQYKDRVDLAKRLGISVATLYRKLEKYELD